MSVLHCNGTPAGPEALAVLAQVNYGHFTALLCREGAVRGLDLHLARLREGTRRLFATELDESRLRAALRTAWEAHDAETGWVRATVFSRAFDFRAPTRPVPVDLLVAVAAAAAPPPTRLRVRPVVFRRHLPQIKHVGTFPLFELRRQAVAQGWDDALFTDEDGCVLEGTTWNLGLWDGAGVTWPEGPALRGTQEQLLRAGLAEGGVAQRLRRVRVSELDGFKGAFACSARGLQWLSSIGEQAYAPDPEAESQLARALDSRPWQPL